VKSVSVLQVIKSVGTLAVDNVSLVESGDDTPPPANDNLVPNAGLETSSADGVPKNWSTNQWGANIATFKHPSIGPNGSKAAEITMIQWADGDAKWYFDDVAVSPGQTYTFSDQYKSTTYSTVVARYTHADNSLSYVAIGPDLPASPEWKNISYSFTAPAGVVSVTIFHLISSVGTLAIDNVSLVRSGGGGGSETGFDHGMVTLTFDDIWNAQDVVLPTLAEAGIKGSFYLVTDDIRGENNVNIPRFMDIHNAGHEVGAHSRTHPDLTKLTPQQRYEEIALSRQDLLDIGISPVNTYAYPFGAYNDVVIQATKDAGFIGSR
jgi:hypothetical protein